jgi:hypothetical protein
LQKCLHGPLPKKNISLSIQYGHNKGEIFADFKSGDVKNAPKKLYAQNLERNVITESLKFACEFSYNFFRRIFGKPLQGI